MAKIQPKLGLKAGELVQVRSVAEILETLDSNGKLDGLPFMPEMLPYCEKTFRVSKRAHKTCEGGLRLIENTVHLEGLRCDGSAHGGCMAGCLLYWSEAWLKRVDPKHDLIALREADPHTGRERFLKTSEVSSQGEVRYRCQATELPTIGQAQPGRSLHQLIKDLSTGNVGIAQLLTVAHWFVNWLYYKGLRKARWQGAFGGPSPDSSFDPKVGETVCVRSKRELLATVDSRGLHRGLELTPDMLRYAGKRFRVLRRIDRLIDTTTGKMKRLKRACVALEDVTCSGKCDFCPRQMHHFWRSLWLEPPGKSG